MSTPGRPTGYRPEYAELARNYCQLGATNAQLSGFFKVAPRTIDNWIVNFPEFGAAVRETRVMADERMWRAVYERGLGYNYVVERTVLDKGEEKTLTRTVHCPADMRAAMIWFRNRSKWVALFGLKPNEVPTGPSGLDPAGEDAADDPIDGGPIPDPGFCPRQVSGEADRPTAGSGATPVGPSDRGGEQGAADRQEDAERQDDGVAVDAAACSNGRLDIDNDTSRPEASEPSMDGTLSHETWSRALETCGTFGTQDRPP